MMLDFARNRQQSLVDLSAFGTKAVRRPLLALAVLLTLVLAFAPTAHGAGRGPGSEAELTRLSEILGAVHHLRQVCNANEGQLWRMKMQELLKLEHPDANLKELMVSRFNRAYHQHRLAYSRCTGQARADLVRFLDEGAALTERLAAGANG